MGNIFNRSKRPTDYELSLAGGMAQMAAGKQASEEQQRREMAEDFVMLKDPNLESILMGMTKYQFTDVDGCLGAPGQTYEGTNLKNAAMAIRNSSLVRTSWKSEKQAQIELLENESFYIRQSMCLTEEEYERGGELIINSFKRIDDTNLSCAINGRLSKLVKSRPHSIDVSVGSNNGKGGNIQ